MNLTLLGVTPNAALLRAQRWLLHLSREGLLAIALSVVAVGFALLVMPPALTHLGQLQADVSSLHDRIRNAARHLNDSPEAPVEQLAAYYRFFPAAISSTRWLDSIYRNASNLGLHLEQGDYRPTIEPGGRLLRYQITLPIKGNYLQIRKFVANLLSEIPIASLDYISFERHRVGEPMVSAKIKLSLYLNPEAR
jgi:Tfp pilus assembly protein PilO